MAPHSLPMKSALRIVMTVSQDEILANVFRLVATVTKESEALNRMCMS